jgi:hypothetical protein
MFAEELPDGLNHSLFRLFLSPHFAIGDERGQTQSYRKKKHYGLNYGFSAFHDSLKKDFFFQVPIASKRTKADSRSEYTANAVIFRMTAALKRLNIPRMTDKLNATNRQGATSTLPAAGYFSQ